MFQRQKSTTLSVVVKTSKNDKRNSGSRVSSCGDHETAKLEALVDWKRLIRGLLIRYRSHSVTTLPIDPDQHCF